MAERKKQWGAMQKGKAGCDGCEKSECEKGECEKQDERRPFREDEF